MKSLEAYINEVDRIALKRFGLNWQDIASDEDQLDQSRLSGETPEEFVEFQAKKRNLTRI